MKGIFPPIPRAASRWSKKKHLLHRRAKKVLIHSRQTIEVRHGLPNSQRFADGTLWLPLCNSIRSRPGRVEPEVFFRVVHAAENGPNCAPAAAYREQMVEIANQAEIARQECITRSRVTQIMGMLRLAPEIQERILSMPDVSHQPLITERILRPIGTITDFHDQLREFHRLLV